MISILHRDERLLVVNKPAGLMTHRSQVAPDRDVVLQRVRDQIGARVWPLHRLDRGTSGALAFALSAEAASELGRQLMQGEVKKAIPRARARHSPGSHRPRVRHPALGARRARPGADELSPTPRLWLLLARARRTGDRALPPGAPPPVAPPTPIAGDRVTGRAGSITKVRLELGIERLVLRASALAFGAGFRPPLTVRAPLAEDFRQALSTLGLDAAGLEELCPLPSAANA
ncbi:MAG: pseudouridine synthase [Polyangiaceae bacterium]